MALVLSRFVVEKAGQTCLYWRIAWQQNRASEESNDA